MLPAEPVGLPSTGDMGKFLVTTESVPAGAATLAWLPSICLSFLTHPHTPNLRDPSEISSPKCQGDPPSLSPDPLYTI